MLYSFGETSLFLGRCIGNVKRSLNHAPLVIPEFVRNPLKAGFQRPTVLPEVRNPSLWR